MVYEFCDILGLHQVQWQIRSYKKITTRDNLQMYYKEVTEWMSHVGQDQLTLTDYLR